MNIFVIVVNLGNLVDYLLPVLNIQVLIFFLKNNCDV